MATKVRKGGTAAPPLPYDEYAEAQVVGTALANVALLEHSMLIPGDFYNHGHREIYAACLQLYQAGVPFTDADVATVSGASLSQLSDLRSKATPEDQWHVDSQKIKDLSHRRRIIGIANRAITSIQNQQNLVSDIMGDIMSELYSISCADSPRLVVFEGAEISVSSTPKYKFTARIGEEVKDISLDSESLDSREKVRRRLRESFHCNAILPENKDDWDSLINSILSRATKTVAPDETTEEQQLAFWIREWKKMAAHAETPDDLSRGYVTKDGFIWFLPERLRSWIVNMAKLMVSSHQLWINVQQWGGMKRSIRVNNNPDSSRHMWGLPSDFFNREFDEQPSDVDLSFLGM